MSPPLPLPFSRLGLLSPQSQGTGAAKATNRRLLSPLVVGASSQTQDGTPDPTPACPAGGYIRGRIVPLSEDCGSPQPSRRSPDGAGLTSYNARLAVCSDAFATTTGVLGAIYADDAFSQVLDLSRPNEDAPYSVGQALVLSESNGSASQAFRFQCEVVARGEVMMGDRCRIQHPDSGLCVGDEQQTSRLVLEDWTMPGRNDGFMWRFCADAQEAGPQEVAAAR